MNPENVGEHIVLKHSSLWRKPLLYEKQQVQHPLCHLQLNLTAAQGQSWRTRNNVPHTPTFPRKQAGRPKTAKDNPMRESVQIGKDQFSKSAKLAASMSEHRKEEGGKVRVAAYPAVGRVSWVMNDYHSRLVNPGFSRNMKGKHFTS